MGLDMYLQEEVYISRSPSLAESRPDSEWAESLPKANQILELAGLKTEAEGGVYVKSTVGYWRKANAIHRWFVENLAAGVDECQEIEVSREQLTELRDTCLKVLDNVKVKETERMIDTMMPGGGIKKKPYMVRRVLNPEVCETHLPTTSGFFFGSTDYDEGYLSDLEDTVNIIDRVLENQPMVTYERDGKEVTYPATDFTYRASW